MLKDALASVANQTSLHSIAQVIVSENGEDRASENVCSEFLTLPIEYYYQQPALPFLEHIQLLLSNVSSAHVAFLHDDDWWATNHLEMALSALSNSNCTSVFTNFVETPSPRHPFTVSYKSFRTWALTGKDFSPSIIHLGQAENFLNCLIDTTYHMSTFVGATNNCITSWGKVVESKISYDCDRTFPIFLGETGNVAYIPASTAFIRIHSGQDSARADYQVNDIGWEIKATTTEWIAKAYPELLVATKELFNSAVLSKLSSEEIDEMLRPIGESQKEALAMICGLDLPISRPKPQPSPNRTAIQKFTQPMLERVARKIYSMLVKHWRCPHP